MSPSRSGENTPLLKHSPSASLYSSVSCASSRSSVSIVKSVDSLSDAVKAKKPTYGTVSGNDDVEGQRNYGGNEELRRRLKFIVPALGIGVFLSALDQTLIASAYGIIGSDLKALNNTGWIATSYFLTLTSFQPLYGRLSDIFGRKNALLFSYIVFAIGSVWCGMARSLNELCIARAFAGIGGGGMTTVVSILMSDIVSMRDRGLWQGFINIIYAAGAGLGAPLGGFLADSIGWRMSFIGQAPICVLAFIAVLFSLDLPMKEDSHWKEKLANIDFLGAITLVVAVFSLLLGLDRGSNEGWTAMISWLPLILSIPLFAFFIFVEMRIATSPFAPGHIIFERSLFACYMCNFFSFAGWLAAIYYLPLFYQAVDGLSATGAGLRLLPGIAAGVSGSVAAGIYMRKTGKYYWLTVICYACLVLGMLDILFFTGLLTTSTIGISIGLVVCGFSNGIGVTSSLLGLITNAGEADLAVATACSYLFRSLGSVVGVSLASTVLQQSLRTQLKIRLGSGHDADEIVQKVRESLDALKDLDAPVAKLVRLAYAKACGNAFLLCTIIVVGSATAAWFIREMPMSLPEEPEERGIHRPILDTDGSEAGEGAVALAA